MRLCSIYSIFQKTKHSQVRFLQHSGKRLRLGMGPGLFVFWSKSIGFGALCYVLVLHHCFLFSAFFLFKQNRSCKMEMETKYGN
jgi:hypothetical protein